MLTPGQIAHYHTFGFLVLEFLRLLNSQILLARPMTFGEDHDKQPANYQIVVPFVEQRPF